MLILVIFFDNDNLFIVKKNMLFKVLMIGMKINVVFLLKNVIDVYLSFNVFIMFIDVFLYFFCLCVLFI